MALLQSTSARGSTQQLDTVLTSRGVATLLGVSISTAQLWMENGILPSWKTPGGHRRADSEIVLLFKRSALKESANKLENPKIYGAPSPADILRTRTLTRSGLLDTLDNVEFNRLTWLAAQLTQAPIALITLLTTDRQWFKSKYGLSLDQTPRDWAFCNYTVAQDDIFTVSDAFTDTRFLNNPLVTGEPRIRFYAGVPIADAAGIRLGALCVIDTEPRLLTRQQARGLRELAAIVCREIGHRKP